MRLINHVTGKITYIDQKKLDNGDYLLGSLEKLAEVELANYQFAKNMKDGVQQKALQKAKNIKEEFIK